MANSNAIGSNHVFVGLDTITWKLEDGNLLIQQRMEEFMEQLKKEFGVGTNAKR